MVIEESKCFIPNKIEDLSKFVLIGREKLNSVRSEIRAIDKLNLAKNVREQKKEEAGLLADALLDAETRMGELFIELPKASGGDRRSDDFKSNSVDTFDSKQDQIKGLGFNKKQVSQFQRLADNKEIVEQVKAEARENDDLPTRTEVLRRIKERDRENEIKEFRKTVSIEPPIEVQTFLAEHYDVADEMLRNNLFYMVREVIIKDKYNGLLRKGLSGIKAVIELAISYKLSESAIKMIVYGK